MRWRGLPLESGAEETCRETERQERERQRKEEADRTCQRSQKSQGRGPPALLEYWVGLMHSEAKGPENC